MSKPLNHSVENIYAQVGQFDRYAIFDFYYGSDASKLYGRMVHGLISYKPSERAILEEAIQNGNSSNNDGIIRLDSNLEDHVLYDRLLKEGFKASDVATLSAMDSQPIKKVYKADGIKEIPNTITIKHSFSREDPFSLDLMNLTHRVKEGLLLLPVEYRRYLVLQYLFNPTQGMMDEIKDQITDKATNTLYLDVAITMNSYYYNVVDQDNETVKHALSKLLKVQRKERVDFILKHLGISQKHLDKLKTDDIVSWRQLMGVVLGFQPTVLEVWGWKYPVWWDFERFIHIYLRHYRSFFIEGSSKGQGTTFDYHYKSIRRLISIVIKNNKVDIESSLASGKPFSKYGDEGYYYHGNYYSFKIDKDGRLMQFHPQEI